MISDDKYIENVKRNYARRKKTGIFILALAVIMSAFLYYGAEHARKDNNELVQSLIPKNIGYTYTETDYELVQSISRLADVFGTKIGMFMGATSVTIAFMFIQSLVLLFGSRKDYLLIKYYDQSKN